MDSIISKRNNAGKCTLSEYSRWTSLNERCRKMGPNIDDFLCQRWQSTNPSGFLNYHLWLSKAISKFKMKNPDVNHLVVTRKNLSKPYSPRNCEITTVESVAQRNRHNGFEQFTFDEVVTLRRYAKENPTKTFRDISIHFGVTNHRNLSKAIRGVTWKNVDQVEPPVKPRLNQYLYRDLTEIA